MSRGYGYQAKSRPPRLPNVADAGAWFKMLGIVQQCAEDAERGEVDEAANLRRMDMANLINRAVDAPFKHGGQATLDMAAAFIKAARAFARAETPSELRRGMAHSIADMARFLDDRLHAIATRQFQDFHHGRTEITG